MAHSSATFHAPGEPWDTETRAREDFRLELRKELGLPLWHEGGPVGGRFLRVTHIEWTAVLFTNPDMDWRPYHATWVAPGDSVEWAEGDVPLGYYAFDRDAECMRWYAFDGQ